MFLEVKFSIYLHRRVFVMIYLMLLIGREQFENGIYTLIKPMSRYEIFSKRKFII